MSDLYGRWNGVEMGRCDTDVQMLLSLTTTGDAAHVPIPNPSPPSRDPSNPSS